MRTPVSVVPMLPGVLGTYQTLSAMQYRVRASLMNPFVVNAARRITAGLDGRDRTSLAARIRNFLDGAYVYRYDPWQQETLQTPREQLELLARDGSIVGDCDDAAILGAALGMSVGLPARFTVLAFSSQPGAPYRHVYTELFTGHEWLELDVTRPNGPVRRAVRVTHVPV